MEWSRVRLGDVLSLKYGKALPGPARDSRGHFEVAGSNGPSGKHSRALVSSPGIVVGRKGSAGKVYWYENDFWPIDTTYYVVPKSPLEIRWSYYLLSSLRLERLATTTGVPGLNREHVYELEIPLPPLSEQRRIVEILDQADRLRRLRAQADAKVQRILPALFVKMFGDPVTNPMAWPKCALRELAIITTGNTPSRKRPEYYGDAVEWVKSDNLNTSSHYVTVATERLSNIGVRVARTARPGSTLVTCIAGSRRAIGNAAIAERKVAFNQQINAATPRPGVHSWFLYGHFVVGKRLVQEASTGGMKGMVSKNRFSRIEFLKPPLDLQKDFGCRCRELCEQQQNQLRQARLFDKLLKTLLYRGFSGELTESWRNARKEKTRPVNFGTNENASLSGTGVVSP